MAFTACYVRIFIISNNRHSRFFTILQIVHIDHNPITYIDPQAFEGLARLNALRIFSHGMKKALKLTSGVSSLTLLELNNFVEDFENMDLKPFIVLVSLDMIRGGLTVVPKNIQYIAGTLQSLSLDNNRIAKLDGMYNVTFEQLGYLYLRHNKISMINVQLLQFPELRQMHLFDNELKQLEDMRFCTWGIGNSFTLGLEIDENPWHCDESMEVTIKTMCRRKGFTYMRRRPLGMRLRLSDMMCESPVDVEGQVFTSVFHRVIQEMDKCPGGELLEAL